MGAVVLDFSKAKPLNSGVQLDFSKAQPIAAPQQEQKGFASSFADSSGLSFFTPGHFIDNVLGIPQGIRQMAKDSIQNVKQGVSDFQKEGLSETTRRDFGRAVPIVGPALAQAQAQHDAGNDAGMAGTLAGTVAGLAAPEAIKGIKPAAVSAAVKAAPGAVVDAAATAARATGEAAQETAAGIVNRTAGMLKPDFKRGASGGRGYLVEGGGVARNMADLADKAKEIKQAVGQRIGQAYKDADASGVVIPVEDVAQAIGKPMQEAYTIAKRVKGLKEDLDFHKDSFIEDFNKGIQQGGFTPSQVFDLKDQLAESTSWGDATQMGMKLVKQRQVGALSGVLEKAIPDLAQANQSYMDLIKMAGRAEERAATGSRPLTAHIKDVSTLAGAAGLGLGVAGGHAELGAIGGFLAGKALRAPLTRTAAASGLFKAGEGLTSIADRIEALRTAATKPSAAASVSQPIQEQAVTSAVQSTPTPIRITKLKRLVK
jgi:hypothetical protein